MSLNDSRVDVGARGPFNADQLSGAGQLTGKIGRWFGGRVDQGLDYGFERWAQGMRQRGELPLSVRLWTGKSWWFCEPAHVKVQILLLSAAAVPYLMTPSLSNLGKAYVEGLIDVEGSLVDIVEMAHQLAQRSLKPEGIFGRVAKRYSHSLREDRRAIEHHYDVSNDFYKLWLDPQMLYSCAYFETGAENLEQAQVKKLDHILTKIQAQPNDRLLDIGCGWGALVIRAAQNFGCRCTGITLSHEQFALAQERVKALGLEERVEIRWQDYRNVRGKYERITSVGMFEHVGVTHLEAYFATIRNLLADDGVAMNHGITSSDADNGQTAYGGGDFIDQYVFPHGELAHIGTVLTQMQRGGLEVFDVESLRRHYVLTLRHWADAFEAHTQTIRQMVGEKKYRIWRIYLLGCAQAFEHDEISLFQVVCRKAGSSAQALPWSRRYMYS